MARNGNGVEIRDKSIRVGFTLNGEFIRETLKINPTPANIKYATNLVAKVNQRIREGTFDYAEFFPDSKRAPKAAGAKTFGDMCDLWLQTKGRLATKSKTQYANSLIVWKEMFGASTAIDKIPHSTIAAKIGSHPWASAKLLNNYLITLRGVFKLAGRDIKMDNPMEGVENSKHQSATPDPLSKEEMSAILKWMEANVDEVVWAYFEFAFMTGMRPEEIIALKWSDIDTKTGTIRVERVRSAGEIKALKTYNSRDVDLVDRSIAALNHMRKVRDLRPVEKRSEFIFYNPVTDRPWHDERSQRDHYWKPALEATGVRYRRAYQTRHTYAANCLSAGVNPTYVAAQMGHKDARMLFTVYAKWIYGSDRGREKAKMEAMLKTTEEDKDVT